MTNWNEIKKRVEFKIGNEIDNEDFILLANESIADLNETARILAPVRRYKKEDIITKDPEHVVSFIDLSKEFKDPDNNIYSVTTTNVGKTVVSLEYTLPFEYNVGYGELLIDTDKTAIGLVSVQEDLTDIDKKSSKVILNVFYSVVSTGKDTDTIRAEIKQIIASIAGGVKFTKRIIRSTGYLNNVNEESVIPVPKGTSTIIKIEYTDMHGNIKFAKASSISAYNFNDYSDYKLQKDTYFIYDGYIHIYTPYQIQSASIYCTRQMNKLDNNAAFTEQFVEFGPNFENVMTFAIHYKWLENIAGPEDSETISAKKSYYTLRNEYESTEKNKKAANRQDSIIVV